MSWTMPAAMVIPYHGSQSDQAVDIFYFFDASGFAGLIVTIAASPAFMKSGFSAAVWPVFGSSSSILQWWYLLPVLYDSAGLVYNLSWSQTDAAILRSVLWIHQQLLVVWLLIRKRLRAWYLSSQRLYIPSDVIARYCFLDLLVMHFNWFHFADCFGRMNIILSPGFIVPVSTLPTGTVRYRKWCKHPGLECEW